MLTVADAKKEWHITGNRNHTHKVKGRASSEPDSCNKGDSCWCYKEWNNDSWQKTSFERQSKIHARKTYLESLTLDSDTSEQLGFSLWPLWVFHNMCQVPRHVHLSTAQQQHFSTSRVQLVAAHSGHSQLETLNSDRSQLATVNLQLSKILAPN